MPPQARRPGKYRLVFTVQSGRDTVKKTIVVEVVPKRPGRKATPDRRPVEVVLTGGSSIRRDIADGVGSAVRVTAALDEDTWTLAGSNAHNVQVVLVDVDRFGLQLVRDLRFVFPSIKLLALTNDPRRLAQSVRAGATLAVPRSTPPKDLARLILQLAKRRA
jgi:DNA-binding NarL/FixJ family response regulator